MGKITRKKVNNKTYLYNDNKLVRVIDSSAKVGDKDTSAVKSTAIPTTVSTRQLNQTPTKIQETKTTVPVSSGITDRYTKTSEAKTLKANSLEKGGANATFKNYSNEQSKKEVEQYRTSQNMRNSLKDINDVTNDDTIEYLAYLTNKDVLTDSDKEDLKQASSNISSYTQKAMSDRMTKGTKYDTEKSLALSNLKSKIDTALNPAVQVEMGAIDSISPIVNSSEQGQKIYEMAGKDSTYKKAIDKSGGTYNVAEKNPSTYTAGQILGSIAQMYGVGSAVGAGTKAATKALKLSGNAAKYITPAMSNTGFAAAITALDKVKEGDWENYGQDFLRNAVMMNALGYSKIAINKGVTSMLGKMGLSTSKVAGAVGGGITAAASSGAGVLATLPTYDKDKLPSSEELAQTWFTLTAFSSIGDIVGGVKQAELNGQAKKLFGEMKTEMAKADTAYKTRAQWETDTSEVYTPEAFNAKTSEAYQNLFSAYSKFQQIKSYLPKAKAQQLEESFNTALRLINAQAKGTIYSEGATETTAEPATEIQTYLLESPTVQKYSSPTKTLSKYAAPETVAQANDYIQKSSITEPFVNNEQTVAEPTESKAQLNTEQSKTLQEAYKEKVVSASDFSEKKIKNAITKGEVKVYSTQPIKPGVEVTPSKMEAKLSGEKVYSKTVPITDVSWDTTLKGQYVHVTEAPKPEPLAELTAQSNTQLNRMIKNYVKEISSELGIKDTEGILNEAITKSAVDSIKNGQSLNKNFIQQVVDTLYNTGKHKNLELAAQYKDLLAKKPVVLLNDALMQNIDSRLKESVKDQITLKKDDGLEADVLYGQYSELYPELFTGDALNIADQLEAIANARRNIQNQLMISNDTLAEQSGIDPAEYKKAVYDAIANKTEKLNKDIRALAKTEAGLTPEERSLYAQEPPVTMEENKLDDWKEARKRTDIQETAIRLGKLAKRMGRTASPEQQAELEELLGNLNTDFKTFTGNKRATLSKALDVYTDYIQNNPDARHWTFDIESGKVVEDTFVKNTLERLNGKYVGDMTNQELVDFADAMRRWMFQVKTANKEAVAEHAMDITELAKQFTEEAYSGNILDPKNKFTEWFRKTYGIDSLRPMTFFSELGGYKEDSAAMHWYRRINNSEFKYRLTLEKSGNLINNFLHEHAKELKDWGLKNEKDAKWSGSVVRMTPLMRVALYCNSKDPHDMRNMVGGNGWDDNGNPKSFEGAGIVIPNERLYKRGQISQAIIQSQSNPYKITERQIKDIIEKDMSPLEKEYAETLLQFYNGQQKELLNETSMLIDGYERASKSTHYPAVISKHKTLNSEEQYNITVESFGALNTRKGGVTGAIVLQNPVNLARYQADGIAKYYGYAPVMRDWNAFRNNFEYDPMQAIKLRMGDAGTEYIDKLLADLSGNMDRRNNGGMLDKLMSKYAGAVFMVNPNVWLVQNASYPLTMSMFDAKAYLAGYNPVLVAKANYEKDAPYSQYLEYRKVSGNINEETGRIKDGKKKGFDPIAGVDWFTVGKQIVAAAKVQAKIDGFAPGTEDYLKRTSELVDRATEATQPNYTTSNRPELLRNRNPLIKVFTMFKTVPFQQYNEAWDGVRNWQYKRKYYEQAKKKYGADSDQAKQAKEDLKEAKVQCFKKLIGIAVGCIQLGITKAAVETTLRGRWEDYVDENGFFDIGKFMTKSMKYAVSSGVGSVYLASVAYDALLSQIADEDTFDIEAPALSMINNLITGFHDVVDSVEAVVAGEKEPKAIYNPILKFANSVMAIFGIGTANIEKYSTGMASNLSADFKVQYEDLKYGNDKSDIKGSSKAQWGDGKTEYEAMFDYQAEKYMPGIKDDVKAELKRLFDIYENTGVFVSKVTSIKNQKTGETVNLKVDETNAIGKSAARIANKNLEDLMSQKEYSKLSDEQKEKAVEQINSWATEYAKSQYAFRKGYDSKPEEKNQTPEYAIYKSATSDFKKTDDASVNQQKKEWLYNSSFDDKTKMAIYSADFESDNTKQTAESMIAESKNGLTINDILSKDIAETAKKTADDQHRTEATAEADAKGYTIPEAEGYEGMPKSVSTDVVDKCLGMGIKPEEYYYVKDYASTYKGQDRINYIESLKLPEEAEQQFIYEECMGDTAHNKCTRAVSEYGIDQKTYVDTWVYGYKTSGSKSERNEQIYNYVQGLSGLSQDQKDFLYECNQVYKGSSGSSSGSGKSSKSSGRKSSSGKSSSKKLSTSKVSIKTTGGSTKLPTISNKKYNYKYNYGTSELQTQLDAVDKNIFMTAKQKAAEKKRIREKFKSSNI